MARCPRNQYGKISHILFDLDGTLLSECCCVGGVLRVSKLCCTDTEHIYEAIMNKIASSYGKELTVETRFQILGRTEQKSAQIMVENLALPISAEEYLSEYHRLSKKLLPDCQLMKGAQRILCHLHANKIPFALATSSSDDAVAIKTAKFVELFKLFNHIVCGSSDPEVKESKPAPDIFLIAASRFADKPDPAQCLVFEDAPNGVCAANSAGMQVVMIPSPATPNELRRGATLVLDSLEDFKPEEFGLPAFPANNCC